MHGNKVKLKCPSFALLWCKMTVEIFELGLIAVQNDFQIFRAGPYCGANRLGLIDVHQCSTQDNLLFLTFQDSWNPRRFNYLEIPNVNIVFFKIVLKFHEIFYR